MADFSSAQRRELDVAVRHLGRAIAAMGRANVPLAEGQGDPVLFAVNEAETALLTSSNRLIDALEACDEGNAGGDLPL